MSTSTLLDAARSYLVGGFSVIPLEARGKKPALDWKVYQQRRPTESELVRWFYRSERNLGLVTGRISGGLTVIDFDDERGWNDWIAEDFDRWLFPTVTTGKGKHVYVKTEVPSGNRRYVSRNIDLRGEGGYVVAPPSVHPSGHDYIWSMANWWKIPTFRSIEDLGFEHPLAPSQPTPAKTVAGMPKEIYSFVMHGTWPGNRDRKAYYAAMRCRECGLGWEQAVSLVAEGLSKSHPDRDPQQWAREKVRNAYGSQQQA